MYVRTQSRFAWRPAILVFVFVLCAGTFLSSLPIIHAKSQQPVPDQTPDKKSAAQAEDRKTYTDKISANYNDAFGKDNISAPGNAAVEGEGFIQPGAFPTAAYCGGCHQEAYHQWRQSLHSNSFRSPFYRTSVNLLINTKGIEFARHCDSCHNPIAVLGGGLTQVSMVDRRFDQDGVTCTTCHSILKLQSTAGNGGYMMGTPSVLVDAQGNRIPGEVPYADILAHPDRHAKAVMQGIYKQAEFCGACHKASLPASLNGYKFIPAFSTYDEWQNSKFSNRNPLTFYKADTTTCQGCHMERAALTLPDSGAKNGTLATHSWPAGNTAVPFYYGFNEQLDKTIAFLKSGNYLNVDIFALRKVSEAKTIAPLGTQPFHLEGGEKVQFFVVIQNKNIGHSLLPEVRDLYEAWVEFTVKDATGHAVFRSGFLKPDGMLDERAHSFTNRPVNTDGNFVDNHKVWTIHSVAYDSTVQAGRSTLVRYEMALPAQAKGEFTVTAKVNYRHFRQSFLNNVFGEDHPAYPVVEIASKTLRFKIGENLPTAAAPHDNPVWMRWNNLGIAYLDQLQYSDAADAFAQVVKLRPQYTDGYTNVAIADIQYEKFDSARASLQRALKLSPGDARALYYSALVARHAGQSDIELADLIDVVRQSPESRDARRELGITYYQRDDNQHALEQFQALQAIDPDDVAAHYNLALLYRRLGMKDKAKVQAALFATKKTDPLAPTYSADYLRRHPEIVDESVPWHVHTEAPPAPHAEGAGPSR